MTTEVQHREHKVVRRRFWRAYFSALATLVLFRAYVAIVDPHGLGAAIWFQPWRLFFHLLFLALLLAPLALYLTTIYTRLLPRVRASQWRQPGTWRPWAGYAVVILAVLYFITLPFALSDKVLILVTLVVLTLLNQRFQQVRRPFWLLIGMVAATVLPSAFLLHIITSNVKLNTDMPIVWVAKVHGLDYTSTPVYWQPFQQVFMQWEGKDYRLKGMSPAFAVRRNEIITLEGQDLVVTPIQGSVRRISLKPHITNAEYILNMQPTPDGVMLNIMTASAHHRVVRINLSSGDVSPVPQASRVCAAESTDRYIANANMAHSVSLQMRDSHDRPRPLIYFSFMRISGWNADPVEGILWATYPASVTLAKANSLLTDLTISPAMRASSATLQPEYRQVWIAASNFEERFNAEMMREGRLYIYAYNGRFLGERTIWGEQVLRAMRIDDTVAQLLLEKYAVPVNR
jgi:hypothetical protein